MISIARDLLITAGALALLTLALVLWTVVDVARRPRWQLSSGQKAMWIIGSIVGWVLVWPVAAVTAVIYLFVLRRRLNSLTPPATPPGAPDSNSPAFGGRPPDLPPAAWYPDPAGGGGERWWDGRGWSDQVRRQGGD
jgi:hypothetical protein